MAAITPDSVEPGTAGNFAQQTQGLRHLRLPFITQTIDTSDTYTLGGEVSIFRAAWEPVNATDPVATTLFNSNIVLLTGTGAASTGYLHLWVNG